MDRMKVDRPGSRNAEASFGGGGGASDEPALNAFLTGVVGGVGRPPRGSVGLAGGAETTAVVRSTKRAECLRYQPQLSSRSRQD